MGSISPRELVLPTDLGLIVTLIGVRRCGKTSLLQHTARELVANGVSSDRIVYLNFEDERIGADFNASDLVNALLLLNPHVALSSYYLFLDEVQAVSQWEKMVYTLHETERARLFITGSNSDLLSVEIATALRGRSLSFELFPFSFSEFLSMRSHKSNLLREESRAEMQNLFDEYLKYGGFPDVCSQPNYQTLQAVNCSSDEFTGDTKTPKDCYLACFQQGHEPEPHHRSCYAHQPQPRVLLPLRKLPNHQPCDYLHPHQRPQLQDDKYQGCFQNYLAITDLLCYSHLF